MAKAQELITSGAFGEAIPLLQRILKLDSHNADAHLLLGTALALLPQRSEALAELRRAIELRPNFAPDYNTLGMALGRFAEADEARQAFEKAIQLDPRFAEAHVNLSMVLAQRKEFVQAGDHITRAIEIQGKSPVAAYSQYLKGKICNEQNMPEEAARAFEEAIRLRPNYAEAYLDLAMTRRRLLDTANCLHAFQKAVELAPRNPTAHYRLGTEYLRSAKSAQAVEHLRIAMHLQPDDRAVLYSLSRALRNNGQAEEAKAVEGKLSEILRSSDKLRETSLEATRLNNEGVELEKSGNLSAALEKYTAALELDPLHGGYRRNLALGLCRLGQWDQGIAELREVLRQNPDDELTTKALYIAMEEATASKAGTPKNNRVKSEHD
jgi:superkiller protein 3